MKNYMFTTTTTMKEYNCKKWWIDGNYIGKFRVVAESLKDAINKYREFVEESAYITISNNAIKNKNAMYRDTPDGAVQTGYVITGKLNFSTITEVGVHNILIYG